MGGQAAVFGAGWVGFGAISAWSLIVAERHNLGVNSQCTVAERVLCACSRAPITPDGVGRPSCAARCAGSASLSCTARIVTLLVEYRLTRPKICVLLMCIKNSSDVFSYSRLK